MWKFRLIRKTWYPQCSLNEAKCIGKREYKHSNWVLCKECENCYVRIQ